MQTMTPGSGCAGPEFSTLTRRANNNHDCGRMIVVIFSVCCAVKRADTVIVVVYTGYLAVAPIGHGGAGARQRSQSLKRTNQHNAA